MSRMARKTGTRTQNRTGGYGGTGKLAYLCVSKSSRNIMDTIERIARRNRLRAEEVIRDSRLAEIWRSDIADERHSAHSISAFAHDPVRPATPLRDAGSSPPPHAADCNAPLLAHYLTPAPNRREAPRRPQSEKQDTSACRKGRHRPPADKTETPPTYPSGAFS